MLVTNTLKRRARAATPAPASALASALAPAQGVPTQGLRERKKAQTRREIQRQALRLFAKQGYEATTVEEIAAAAGVSHMTFFRYFPTKEDVVIADDYDPLLARLISTRPADEPDAESIRRAAQAIFERVYESDRDALLARTRLILYTPALRARMWENGSDSEQLIVRALAARAHHKQDDLRVRVIVAACLAAVMVAIQMWAEHPGKHELPDLIDQALSALQKEFS